MLIVNSWNQICRSDDTKTTPLNQGGVPFDSGGETWEDHVVTGQGHRDRRTRDLPTAQSPDVFPGMGARHISRLLWTFAAQEGMGALSLMLLQDTMRLMLLGDYVKQDYMVHDTKAKQQLCAGRQAAMEPSTFC